MDKTRANVVVWLFLTFCFTLLAFYLLGVDYEVVLSGVTAEPVVVERNIITVLNGEYQKYYDNWFLENYPFRGIIIKTYNQFKYSFLRKSPNTNIVMLKDGSLINPGYVRSYLAINTDKTFYETTIREYDEYAKNLKTIQDKLEEQDKSFIYLIAPSKAEINSEDLPLKYILNSRLDTYKNRHQILVDALEKYDVKYFDSTQTMMHMKQTNKYEPFPGTGGHWTYYASIIAVQDFFDAIDEQCGLDLPRPVIDDILELSMPSQKYDNYSLNSISNDDDVLLNINVFKGKLDDVYTYPIVSFDLDDYEPINLMRLGTSFDANLTYSLGLNKIFEKQDFFSYLNYHMGVNEKGKHLVKCIENDVNNIDFYKVVNSNDLFYIENTAIYVPNSHFVFVESMADFLTNVYKSHILTEDNNDIEIIPHQNEILFKKGTEVNIKVTIVNNEEEIHLSSKYDNPLYLSYHITDKEGNMLVREGKRTGLENDIKPGMSEDVEMTIKVPELAGEYILQITFLHENLYWGEKISDNFPIELPLIIE